MYSFLKNKILFFRDRLRKKIDLLPSVFIHKQDGEKIIKRITIVCIVLASILFAVHLYHFFQVSMWRHDHDYYTSLNVWLADFEGGRWISYLFFYFKKYMPAHAGILIAYAGIFYFSYCAALRATQSILYSILIALTAIQLPILTEQNTWPVTLFMTSLFLGLAAYACDRIKMIYFFPLFAIFFWGTFIQYYFLLPILFVKQIDKRTFFRILLWWIVGFIVGYIVTQIIVYFSFHHFMQVAEWRNLQLASSWHALKENWIRIFGVHDRNGSNLFHNLRAIRSVNFNFINYLFVILCIYFLVLKKHFYTKLIYVAVILSIYLLSVAQYVILPYRSHITLWLGIIFIIFVIQKITLCEKYIFIPLLFLFYVNLANINIQSITWYKKITKTLQYEIAQALPTQPQRVQSITFLETGEGLGALSDLLQARMGIIWGGGGVKKVSPLWKQLMLYIE